MNKEDFGPPLYLSEGEDDEMNDDIIFEPEEEQINQEFAVLDLDEEDPLQLSEEEEDEISDDDPSLDISELEEDQINRQSPGVDASGGEDDEMHADPHLNRFPQYRYFKGGWIGQSTLNSTSQFGINLEFTYLSDCSDREKTIIKYEEKKSGGLNEEMCAYITVEPTGTKAALTTSCGVVEYQVVTRGRKSLIFQAETVCGSIYPYIKRTFRVVDHDLHYETEYHCPAGTTGVHHEAILQRVQL